jgi:surface polysaccharide O-acyltransferase-like enzyme
MSEAQSASARSAQIDLMRAAAILAVVLIHVWGPSTEVTLLRGPLHAAFFVWFVSGSVWAVPLFFFVSGLLLTRRAEVSTWQDRLLWLRRRAARLLPPYLFWSAVCLAVARQTDVVAILRSLAFGTASYQMYFVVALVQAYVLWWLVMPWLQGRTPRTQSAVLLSAFALTLIVHVLRALYLALTSVDHLPFMRATVLPWIGYFALGCLVTLRQERAALAEQPSPAFALLTDSPALRQRLALYLGLLAFVCLAIATTCRVTYRGPHFDDPVNTLLKPVYSVSAIWLVGALGLWWQRRARAGGARLIAALARDSYGIYLSHVLVMRLLSGYVYIQLLGLGLGLEIAYRVVALLITIGVSWGIVHALSLVPGVRWLSGAA